jgi:hypothetical protein
MSAPQDAIGAPFVIPPTGPERASDRSLPEFVTYPGRANGDLYPAVPFTSSEIAEPKKPPYRRHGKVFFENGGVSYSCSGTIVTAANESVVATAGHCLFDDETDLANTSTTFVPAYKDGQTPFGVWDATHILTTEEWMNGSDDDLRYDIGMVVLERHGTKTIQQVLGSRGISFRQDPLQSFESYGYPADGPFDGDDLFSCASGPGFPDPLFPDPAPIAMGCDMSRGSSGGGRLIQTRQGDVVNSVNSYLYPAVNGLMFGPYFGNIAEALYRAAAGTRGGAPPPPPGERSGQARDGTHAEPGRASEGQGIADALGRFREVRSPRSGGSLQARRPVHRQVGRGQAQHGTQHQVRVLGPRQTREILHLRVPPGHRGEAPM